MTRYRIALIPGDGIGAEVLPPATALLDAVGARHGLSFAYDSFDWSRERFLAEGTMMPADGLDLIRHHDAILLGAVGWPGVPDHVSLWGLLIPIRRQVQQYVNLRPVKVLQGVPSPLRAAEPGSVDLVVVRENVEGEYSEIGGRLNRGLPDEMALQQSVFTRPGVTRIVEYAYALAEQRGRHLTSATKSNGIVHTMPLWDELVAEAAARHPDVRTDTEHIDALAAKLVLHPARFDVIVGSNLFGDILSDLAAAVAGSIGVAPAANLNPQREFPSMFEPVHGSAPDIAGQGHGQPAGRDLVGVDAARPPRPPGRPAPTSSTPPSAPWQPASRRPTSAARRRPSSSREPRSPAWRHRAPRRTERPLPLASRQGVRGTVRARRGPAPPLSPGVGSCGGAPVRHRPDRQGTRLPGPRPRHPGDAGADDLPGDGVHAGGTGRAGARRPAA